MANYLHGYDIASYQAGINNAAVQGDFVIVKATQGVNYINPAMQNQISSAKKGNKKIGLYHFANAGSWKAEADYFIRVAKPYLSNTVLVLDYEGGAVPAGGTAWAKNWLDYVYGQTGIKPMIYLGLADENNYNWLGAGVANKYPLWVAQYNNMNTVYGYQPRPLYGKVRNWNKITIFQYTSTGKLSGYGGSLDLDVFYGNSSDWYSNTKKKNTSSTDTNKGGIDGDMMWSIKVAPTDVGGFRVEKAKGLATYEEPNNYHMINKPKLKAGTRWRVSALKDGFARISKTKDKDGKIHEIWVDTTGGSYKGNPITSPDYKHLTIYLGTDSKGNALPAKLHKTAGGEPYGNKLPKGTKYKAVKYDSKTGYFAVKDSKGNLVYVNGAKFLVLLGGN